MKSAATYFAARVSPVVLAAIVLAIRSSIVDGQSAQRMSRADEKPEAVVDAQGNLHVPSSYRTDYEFLGTWAIAADKGVGSGELHNVYASPGAKGERHLLLRILSTYLVYYNEMRTHLSLGKDAPEPRSVQPPAQGRVVEVPRVGGLHHEYLRRGA